MKFVYRGTYSKGANTLTVHGVSFTGNRASEVTDTASISWFGDHPDYFVADEAEEEPAPKKPRKAKAKK